MQLERFPLIILAFAIGGCSVPNDADLEQERTTSADAAIRSLPVDDWCRAEADRDIEAKMKLFTTDAVLMPPGKSDVIGQHAIRAWHEKMWKGTKYQCSGTIDEVHVFGDWGMVRGTFSGEFTPASDAPQRVSGRFLNTVRQQTDGSWKIAHGIWNSNLTRAVQAQSGLEGEWRIEGVTIVGGANEGTYSNPQPSLFIFTGQHYSTLLVPGDTPRQQFPDQTTDEEKLAAFDNFIANSGTYQVTGSTLTVQPFVAKVPNAMVGEGFSYEYSLDGNSLILVLAGAAWAPSDTEITYRLSRLE